MDKLKKGLKKIITPALILLLVAVMGVFSPVISVVGALRLNTADAGVGTTTAVTIEGLPARTVTVGDSIVVPTVTGATAELWHAGRYISSPDKYTEVGQYEWRFYITDGSDKVLYDTYTVTATKTAYTMTMPSDVITVAPKNMDSLVLPLPAEYTVNGNTVDVKVEAVENQHYAKVTLTNTKKSINEVCHLSATVSMENDTFDADKVTVNAENLTIDLAGHKNSGKLKVTYRLEDESGNLMVATPLNTIEIKNVEKSSVTFANIPTAPSVSGLAYYSDVTLTAPAADSATAGKDSFTVEAQTTIVKVQACFNPTEPEDWDKASNVKTYETVDGVLKDDAIEIDGLKVKVKKLGWYRFQFQTGTLFGYTMNSSFSNSAVDTSSKDYVKYWGDSVLVKYDNISPDFAWVNTYGDTQIDEFNKKYEDGELTDFNKYLPLSTKPDSTTTQKITVGATGLTDAALVLPAIFPHDNATAYGDLKVSALTIEQIEDANGNSVDSGTNVAYKSTDGKTNGTTFTYNQQQALKVKFADNQVSNQGANEVTLVKSAGLYRISITVLDQEPVFEDTGKSYSSYNNSRSTTRRYYFYLDDGYDVTSEDNSPVVDVNKTFQVSDVYQWEGNTFEFAAPKFSDAHTPNNDLVINYYLVDAETYAVIGSKELPYNSGASTITVSLKDFALTADKDYYVYAVARNFNGMQGNMLKELTGVADLDNDKYFNTNLFGTIDQDEVRQNGYAWKRAKFTYHAETTTVASAITITPGDSNVYKAGNKIALTASAALDAAGQISIGVYSKKDHTAYDLYNGTTASAEVVSSIIANKSGKYNFGTLYFTPDVSGDYLVVVTAKAHASKNIYTKVVNISIDSSEDYYGDFTGLSTSSNKSDSVAKTITLGTSITMPGVEIKNGSGELKYVSRNNNLYDPTNTNTPNGYYTITVMGVSDANCITGNRFTPNKTGKYKFKYQCYQGTAGTEATPFYTKTFVVQVNANSSSDNILMGEAYNDDGTVLFAGVTKKNNLTENFFKIGDDKYPLGTEYVVNAGEANEKKYTRNTSDVPAYAITLPEFKYANYGASKDFVVDSAWLFKYLEPIYSATADNKISGYMYPAIAIPMPNVISDTTSSNEVEITVQKSGSSNKLVASKATTTSAIKNAAEFDYYVFRPEGTFKANVTDDYNANNYTNAATSTGSISGVYTVTYKTSTSSVSYNITFGNMEDGEITLNEGFLTYNDGKKDQNITEDSDKLIIDKDKNGHRYVTIDMAKLAYDGNETMLTKIGKDEDALKYFWEHATVTVYYGDNIEFIKSSDWVDENDTEDTKKTAIFDANNYTYKFDLTKGSGTYKVNVSLTNEYTNNPVTASIEFTLDAESTHKNINLNTVWGIILIVLSVGLLAGVIFYFVKTARDTRFVDAPRAMKKDKALKAPKAEKASDQPVAAPKTEEAPKKDAE